MRMTIRETTVCQICPLNFTCDHIGSTIERIAILKALVLFFGLKNKGKVTSDLPPLVVFGLIPLLPSTNHWTQQELHTNWPKLLWTLVPVMQRLKGVFDLAGERTTFISRQITPFSSAFFGSYRLYQEGSFR